MGYHESFGAENEVGETIIDRRELSVFRQLLSEFNYINYRKGMFDLVQHPFLSILFDYCYVGQRGSSVKVGKRLKGIKLSEKFLNPSL